MNRPSTRRMMRAICLALTILMTAAAPAPAETQVRRLLVLDFEIVDTSGEPIDQRAQHAERLRLVRDFAAKELAARKTYAIADKDKIAGEIAGVLEHQYLRSCNGCEITLAEHAGADLVMTGQINKVSTLIMSMTVEMKDVKTGERRFFQRFDFRGDTDQSWLRAARYLVDRIGERPPG